MFTRPAFILIGNRALTYMQLLWSQLIIQAYSFLTTAPLMHQKTYFIRCLIAFSKTKAKQNKTKQDVLQTCIRGDRRNWENSVDQETESKCLLTTEHEHLLIKKTFLLAPPNEKKKKLIYQKTHCMTMERSICFSERRVVFAQTQ